MSEVYSLYQRVGCSACARVPSQTMERPEDTHDPMIHLHCARGVSYRSSDRGAAIQALSSQMMNDPETMREFQEAMASGKGGFTLSAGGLRPWGFGVA